MYVVTNRKIIDSESGLSKFGSTVNEKGSNELRLADINKSGRGWSVSFLDDALAPSEVASLIDEFNLPIDPQGTYHASLKVACDITRRAREQKRHILFFVHGYNNDLQDVMSGAHDLQSRFGIEVIPFTWPANGGGIFGTLSYKSDKLDAEASTAALYRTLGKIHGYIELISRTQRQELYNKAARKHPNSAEARDKLYAQLLKKECPVTVNAMFHSMGNYLLKKTLISDEGHEARLTFENITLCQADTNNQAHAAWVDRLRFRNRLFITLNENDSALQASRLKLGSAQLARLGHYVRNLNSKHAHYINLTDAAWVGDSHSPFSDPAKKNAKLAEFFKAAFSGDSASSQIRGSSEGNWFRLRG